MQRDDHSSGSVTYWIRQLGTDQPVTAERKLWGRYFTRLSGFARGKLHRQTRGEMDEEDVALLAFHSFFVRARAGQFSKLDDRADLWRLLVTLASRKAINAAQRQQAQRRIPNSVISITPVSNVAGRDPEPAVAAEWAEQFQLLLNRLESNLLRSIAVKRLHGHTKDEIASELHISPSTRLSALATVEPFARMMRVPGHLRRPFTSRLAKSRDSGYSTCS